MVPEDWWWGKEIFAYILQLLPQNSATFNTLCYCENSLFSSIMEDYFFFVSPAPPVLLEMDSLISVSDWMF